jgi:DNA polymerase III epsilon subunit family exonuclease
MSGKQLFAVLDTETTGLEGGTRAVELSAIIFDEEGPISFFETLVNPGMPIPADVVAIHGITDDMVKDAPATTDALLDLWRFIPSDAILVAHNAPYDTGIISWDSARVGLEVPPFQIIDTCALAKSIGATKNNKLETLIAHYGIERVGDAHRALSDAHGCMDYFIKVWDVATKMGAPLPWYAAGHNYAYFDVTQIPEVSFLPSLVADGAPFSFVYEDDKGACTERTILPYGWAKKYDNHYFHGLCDMRKERRTFRADRIIEVLSKTA